MATIDKFEGQYRFLSNFWPVTVSYASEDYPSVEHAYQAAKFVDLEKRKKIRENPDPKVAKRLGKSKGIREDWDTVKLGIMTKLVHQKFKNNLPLANKLIATNGSELVEGNWWGDTYWGVCKGIGENHLGKILMTVREELGWQ